MLLSSSAETMFWIGRYLERAQALSRAIQSYQRASLDLPGTASLDLRPLLGLVGAAAGLEPSEVLPALILDRKNPSCVLGALNGARENLRRGRTIMAPEAWQILNGVHLKLTEIDRAQSAEILLVLDDVIAASSRIEGELTAGMTRDSAYSFLRIGWLLERADMVLRVTSLLFEVLAPGGAERTFDDVRWIGVLDSIAAYAMYRRRHHARVAREKALEFVFLDAAFPRSPVHCIQQIERELENLPRPQAARAALLGCLPDSLEVANVHAASELRSLTGRLLSSMAAFNTAMATSYFPGQQPPPVESAPLNHSGPAASDPFDHLEHEHREMEALLRVVDELSLSAERGEVVDRPDLEGLLSIFGDWGQFGHQEKEEDVLTPILVAHGFDWYDGPLASVRRDHRQDRSLMRALADLSSRTAPWSAEDRRHFAGLAREYANFLRSHMRREQEDLFPRARVVLPAAVQAEMLVRFGHFDVELRRQPATGRVRAEAKRLLQKYGITRAPTVPISVQANTQDDENF